MPNINREKIVYTVVVVVVSASESFSYRDFLKYD
jgi:hypothetical protein